MSRALTTLLKQLHEEHPVKTWSLIITFFGDSIVPRGGSVSAATVQTLMQELGVGAGAVRTAFSRLAKDNWVEREKRGRNSFYRLSATGHEPFYSAAARIYARPPKATAKKNVRPTDETSWMLATRNPLDAEKTDWKALVKTYNGVKLTNNVSLFSTAETKARRELVANNAVVMAGTLCNVPEWLRQLVGPPKLAARYVQLQRQFESIADNPPANPLTSMAIRCLLIHEWRRLLLRSNDLHGELLPANWPRDECHRFVASLYHQLTPDANTWLNKEASGPEGKLVISDNTEKSRFR